MKLIDPRIYEGFLKIATGRSKWFNFFWGMKAGIREACKDGSEREIGEDELLQNLSVDGRGEGSEAEGPLDTVHRKDFLDVLDVLDNLVPPGTAIFNKRLTGISIPSISSKVEMSFQDGTTAYADAVIGCDGIRSVTRDFVLGQESTFTKPVFSGKYCYRGLADIERAKEVLGERMEQRQMFLAKHGHVLTYLVEGGKTVNIVAMHASTDGKWQHPTWIQRVSKEEMLKDFEEHSGVVRNILEVRLFILCFPSF